MANYMGPDAFRLSHGKKRPRINQEGFLAFVRRLPCLVCLRRGQTEAAHIRFTWLAAGKPMTGSGRKPDDRWCVPLCQEHHRDQHADNEIQWWKNQRIDPIYVAAVIYGHWAADDLAAADTTVFSCRDLGRY